MNRGRTPVTLTVVAWVAARRAEDGRGGDSDETAATTASAAERRRTDIEKPPQREVIDPCGHKHKLSPVCKPCESATPSRGTTIVKTNAARPIATSSGRVEGCSSLSHLARQPRPENEVVECRKARRARRAEQTFASSVQRKPGPGVPVVGRERDARDAEHEQRAVADRAPALAEHAHARPRDSP